MELAPKALKAARLPVTVSQLAKENIPHYISGRCTIGTNFLPPFGFLRTMARSRPSGASRKLYLKGKIGGRIFSGECITRTKFLEYCRTNPCQVFEAILAMQEYFIRSTTGLRGLRDEYSTDIPEEADDMTDDEQYEVDYILDSRTHNGNLQYRVKWAGYKDDPEWYGAENFERAPYRLEEFHFRYPWKPGPPKDLDDWLLRAGDDELT